MCALLYRSHNAHHSCFSRRGANAPHAGCSSLIAFFTENGPPLVNATGGLVKNPYSWTMAGANLLAFETPLGTGFSYCSRQINSNGTETCVSSDTSTARTTRAALVDFFDNKFPELKGGDLYLTGESYAGVYLPTLAKAILDDESNNAINFNLKGYGVSIY